MVQVKPRDLLDGQEQSTIPDGYSYGKDPGGSGNMGFFPSSGVGGGGLNFLGQQVVFDDSGVSGPTTGPVIPGTQYIIAYVNVASTNTRHHMTLIRGSIESVITDVSETINDEVEITWNVGANTIDVEANTRDATVTFYYYDYAATNVISLGWGTPEVLDPNLTHQAGPAGGILVLHRDPSVAATSGYSVLSDLNPVPTAVVAAYEDTDNNAKRETVTLPILPNNYWTVSFAGGAVTDQNLTATFYPFGTSVADDGFGYRHWLRAV